MIPGVRNPVVLAANHWAITELTVGGTIAFEVDGVIRTDTVDFIDYSAVDPTGAGCVAVWLAEDECACPASSAEL